MKENEMKENHQIYLLYQFCLKDQLVDGDAQISYKKMKTLFLSIMSKSRRLISTFFPRQKRIPMHVSLEVMII